MASLRETTPARPAMSEDEQLAAALQESLQVVTPPSSYAPSSSLGGGATLDVDMNVSGNSDEPVENVYAGDAERGIEAPRGKYK